MLEYLENNRRVYDALAEEFQAKIAGRDGNTKRICDEFCSALAVSAVGRCVLELGAGPGMISRELGDRGYAVTALEFAPKMAEVCRRNAPDAILIVDEFLAHDFGVKKFDGIVAIAFVHMFSSAEIGAVFAKIKTLLAPQSVVYLSTTIHDEPTEGYFSKVNFEQPLKRFRKRFTRLELEGILAAEGFVVVYSSFHNDNEERGKTWMNYIVS